MTAAYVLAVRILSLKRWETEQEIRSQTWRHRSGSPDVGSLSSAELRACILVCTGELGVCSLHKPVLVDHCISDMCDTEVGSTSVACEGSLESAVFTSLSWLIIASLICVIRKWVRHPSLVRGAWSLRSSQACPG
ncbi:hypothetical protein RRG08_011639 [Elysia crispata]|uniref:Uncharacterized protein n=1 Tax=Elysia crispata TaxID=231223 RepID=A0AAE1D095_9GAST|nr:hypothetical protein RRG08_011639 [Elysia crispata]